MNTAMFHAAPSHIAAEKIAPHPVPVPRGVGAPILALDNVSLSFGGVKALAHVDLVVGSGDIHAVIGPNGAGKSSLISGLYRPDSGRVRIGDNTFTRVPTARLSRLGVARTFQNLALFPNLNVLDNVTVGLAGTARATIC